MESNTNSFLNNENGKSIISDLGEKSRSRSRMGVTTG